MTTFVIVQPDPIDRDAVRPSVEDVAGLERTRTVDEGDNELTTFTAETRPTADEVDWLIDEALDEVLSRIPTLVFPEFNGQIRRLVTLLTATMIEGSYYREQTANGPVALWQRQFDNSLADLQKLLRSGIL